MKLVIFGAEGATGRLLLANALQRGHTVTVFAADPSHVDAPPEPALRVVVASMADAGAIVHAISGHDVVLFCVGADDRKATASRADAIARVTAGMDAAGVKRLIALSGLGAGVTRASMGFLFDKVLANTVLRGFLEDVNGMEAALRRSKLDWIVVRTGELTDETQPSHVRIAASMDGHGISTTVSRRDVVAFVLDQLARSEYVRAPVAVGY